MKTNTRAKARTKARVAPLDDPTDTNIDIMRRMIRELACCEWQGASGNVQDLIFEARKMAGWSRSQLME